MSRDRRWRAIVIATVFVAGAAGCGPTAAGGAGGAGGGGAGGGAAGGTGAGGGAAGAGGSGDGAAGAAGAGTGGASGGATGATGGTGGGGTGGGGTGGGGAGGGGAGGRGGAGAGGGGAGGRGGAGAGGGGAGGRGGGGGSSGSAGAAGGGGGGVWRIAVGGQRACAASPNGVAYCWGTNTNLLGLMVSNNYSLDSAAPVDMTPLLGQHVVDTAVTDFDLCALKDEGSIFCNSRDGSQLVSGIGGPATQICIAPVGVGFGFGCALRADGKVLCWSDSGTVVNPLGGGGPFSAVEAPGVDGAVGIACDGGTACAVTSGGTVWCWGAGWGTANPYPSSGEMPRLVAGLGSDVATLQGGEGGICAFSRSGGATCLGSVFGVTQNGLPLVPVAVPALNAARALAIGDRHVCAVGADGALRCWGANDFGQLANGTFAAHTAPALATALGGGSGGGGGGGGSGGGGSSVIAQLAAGEGVTCASFAGGAVRCVGSNDRGALGDGSALNPGAVPVALAASASVAAYQAAIDTTAFALLSDGSVVAWGGLPSVLAPAGGPPLETAAPAPVAAPPTQPAAVQAFVTGASACLRAADGAVRCLKTGTPASFAVVPVLASGAVDLDRGCAVPAGGGVRCGLGLAGLTPTAAPGSAATGAVAALAVGFGGTCLLRPDGTVECWPANVGTPQTKPVLDLGGAAVAIAVGDEGCAVRDDGAVLCWPIDGYVSPSAQYVQLPVAAVGITAASGVVCWRSPGAGCFADQFHGHACAWTATGDLYCWGDNTFGQLGDGTTASHTNIVKVTAPGGPVLSASAGNRQTCALRAADHRLLCWGWNGAGELGTGTGGPHATSTAVALP